MHIIHRVFHTVMLTATPAQKWSKVRGSDKRVYSVASAWYDGEKRREGDSVMKPVFATDLTENKHNTEPNGREFLTQEPSDALRRRHEEMLGRMNETMEKSQLAKPLRVVEYVCSMGWLITLCGILRAVLKADHPTAQLRLAYRNAPGVFWAFGVCLLVWAALRVLGRRKSRQMLETEESERVFARTENSMSAIFDELGVPHDAQEVDVLTFFYKEKGGECRACEKTMQMNTHFNPIFRLFFDDENLYLANLDGKYNFPRVSLRGIRRVNKRIRLESWNKEEPCNQGRYKAYKLSEGDNGLIYCKPYYILELDRAGERWGIYFPCYELPAFERATGLTAEE